MLRPLSQFLIEAQINMLEMLLNNLGINAAQITEYGEKIKQIAVEHEHQFASIQSIDARLEKIERAQREIISAINAVIVALQNYGD